MSFEQNRMDFEKALMECEEICNALDVLIKPEILNTFITMIEEYRIHYSSNINELVSEIDALNDVCDSHDAYVADLLKTIEASEHEILDLQGDIKQLQKDLNKNDN